ncbi:hypothetical protein L3X38_036606 [Prunus dulcis]|uniref:Uncharacterized protein n=1 Tax=Prunus dulcis TaxID=3755 RepID=A0AAD4YPW9_PRUDU|nr:hypothetical protein L3X38_036606 [Prunus dulcis]
MGCQGHLLTVDLQAYETRLASAQLVVSADSTYRSPVVPQVSGQDFVGKKGTQSYASVIRSGHMSEECCHNYYSISLPNARASDDKHATIFEGADAKSTNSNTLAEVGSCAVVGADARSIPPSASSSTGAADTCHYVDFLMRDTHMFE